MLKSPKRAVTREKENVMNKKNIAFAAILVAGCSALACAQPMPPEQLAAFRRQLLLVVWVPLILALIFELVFKSMALMRFGAQEKRLAVNFALAATLAEFALNSAAMMLLFRPLGMLRAALAGSMGMAAAATVTGLISTAVMFLVFWKLYAMALKRFLGIGAAPEGQSEQPARWGLGRLSALMAALHPVLLHIFTVLAFVLLVKR